MVEAKIISDQLKAIKFGGSSWNQAEIKELPHIIHEDEKILECVNGLYEGGVALLVASDQRVLLVDKKPFNFLTVEDLRFDMINEIDYSHRLLSATIIISTGSKTLRFSSLNQGRLRHLISLVQEHMSQSKTEQTKKIDNQQQHLEEINKQLQMYLLAQHQHLQRQVEGSEVKEVTHEPITPKPSPELSDYLFAQRLLEKFYTEKGGQPPVSPPTPTLRTLEQPKPEQPQPISQQELVDDARREIFTRQVQSSDDNSPDDSTFVYSGQEVNPLKIAYSKLPMMLRNRKFGRPSLHAHSQQPAVEGPPSR